MAGVYSPPGKGNNHPGKNFTHRLKIGAEAPFCFDAFVPSAKADGNPIQAQANQSK